MKLRTDHDIPAPAYPNGTGTRPVAARRPGRTASGWVAEAPEAHLLPHFQAACDEAGSLLHLDEAWSDDEIFVVELSATKPDLSVGHLRHAAIVLAAAIAEESTSIRQRRDGDLLEFDVATGSTRESGFAPHGHLVRLRIHPRR
jgi:hypothetical protein